MKIVGIRPVLLQATYEAGSELRWAGGRIESWDAALVEIHTESGVTRLGEVAQGIVAAQAVPGIVAALRGYLDGVDFADPRRVGDYRASVVAAVPALDENIAYISSGTWSLVGVELDAPVLTTESREANFTNEIGIDGRIMFLRNVGGFWLMQECLRWWADHGKPADLQVFLAAASARPSGGPAVDVDSMDFVAPDRMPLRIQEACRSTGQRVPETPERIVRCVLDSLAAAYARTLEMAVRLSGKRVEAVHVVGGDSKNALLCQLTADACGLPVVAGPAEATAIGNMLVQARAAGDVPSDHNGIRTIVARSFPVTTYQPRIT